jgi:hypothetical protein
MFPLTRPVRQSVCTILLLAFTVLPTLAIAAIAWRINQPGHVRDVEVELGRKLGMHVSLDATSYPAPGEVIYKGIVLRAQEPRGKEFAEIGRADGVRLSRSDHDLTILLENPQLHAASPGQGMAVLDSIIQRSISIPFERVGLSTPSCRLDLGNDNLQFTFMDMAGEFVSDPSAPTLKLAYRVPGSGKGSRCELVLTRDRRTEPFETSLSFRTIDGSPLPARMLSVFFDADDWLGAEARIAGTLELRHANSSGWKATFTGEILDVDLARLINKRFPRHRLTGRARITFQKAAWGQRPSGQGPGWVEARGQLVAGPGSIGLNLYESLAREMKFRPGARRPYVDPRKPEVEFRSLGLSFAMQPTGEIQLSGALGNEFPPDAVLASSSSTLLSAPQGAASVHSLIKALFPAPANNPGVLIPLTSESQVLLSLPLPRGADSTTRPTLDAN